MLVFPSFWVGLLKKGESKIPKALEKRMRQDDLPFINIAQKRKPAVLCWANYDLIFIHQLFTSKLHTIFLCNIF